MPGTQSSSAGSMAGRPVISPFPPEHIVAIAHQQWNHATFLHWSCDPAVLWPVVPKSLEIDTFENKAWVGVIPFIVEKFRPALLPPFPFISRFPETNVRTYVIGPDGCPGVWFFSLDAKRLLPVIAGR